MEGTEGAGISLCFKNDQRLFRRNTRNTEVRMLRECQFADDGALLASSRTGIERAIREYQITCSQFGLTVSLPKTKHMVSGRQVVREDREPIEVAGGEIEGVEEFPYLGSVITASGKIDAEVETRIAKASRAFGASRKAVFLDRNLTLCTKRKLYQACVLSVLMYGAVCWTLLGRHVKKLNTFHHWCMRIILGVSNMQQWTEKITMAEVRRRWGDEETIEEKIQRRKLEWLGHFARMLEHRIPKSILLGWLSLVCMCRLGLERHGETHAQAVVQACVAREVECLVCSRKFRRESDKKRHKCLEERSKPLCEQRGATQCPTCKRWFKSRGGLAVHRCRPPDS